MQLKKLVSGLILILFSFKIYAQPIQISGRIFDNNNNQPLPFVNIIDFATGNGTTSDIDGNFDLQLNADAKIILVSTIGYKKDTIQIIPGKSRYYLYLTSKPYAIDEVTIFPGENPAMPIIRKVLENMDNNHPNNLPAYTYKSYNKTIFTVDKDSLEAKISQYHASENNLNTIDSSLYSLRDMIDEQHLFFIETVTRKKYKKPGKEEETILASKTSGFKDPLFSLLAVQMQSFTFYDEFFQVLDKRYVNPLDKKSLSRYVFILEDTLTHSKDSVFVVRFQPKINKNFESLKGFLHINTNGYAIQRVVAEPSNQGGELSLKIQQNYQLIEDSIWFPAQLQTYFYYNNLMVSETEDKSSRLLGINKSYIREINLYPSEKELKFSRATLIIDPLAGERDSSYWNANRYEKLDERDNRTIEALDSLTSEVPLERIMKGMESLLTGYLTVGKIDLDLNKLIDYNRYEGLRLGMGLRNNHKISNHFEIGGYTGYGFRDKKWKYGGHLKLSLDKYKEHFLLYAYDYDLKEIGGFDFLEPKGFQDTEIFRDYLVNKMDFSESHLLALQSSIIPYTQLRFFGRHSEISPFDDYSFVSTDNTLHNQYNFFETGIKIRFSYQEEKFQSIKNIYRQGSNYPVLLANYTKGFQNKYGEFSYDKIAIKIKDKLPTKFFGTIHYAVMSGWINNSVPLSSTFNGFGSYHNFTLDAENTFGSMKLNEFYNQRFVYVFYKHSFKEIFTTNFVSPGISFVHNFGIGDMSEKYRHVTNGKRIRSMDKGFYEAGILVEDLLTQSFFSYGIGTYYRYGAYSYSKPSKNLAWKLVLRIQL